MEIGSLNIKQHAYH